MTAIEKRRQEVNETFVEVLATRYGHEVEVAAVNAETGRVKYRLPSWPFALTGWVYLGSERAAVVWVEARLGRCYTGYRRALRWLLFNRAGNSVGMVVSERRVRRRELCAQSSRVTLPGDEAGINEQLNDVETECFRLRSSLEWFPQLAEGWRIAKLEEAKDEAFDALLADPAGFASWALENRAEALERFGTLPAEACRWLGRWEESLSLIDEKYQSFPAEKQRSFQPLYLEDRLKLLKGLKRYEEVLRVADELDALKSSETDKYVTVGARLEALCGLGRAEEAAELAKPARYDVYPRVWYWRSVASAMQQQFDESVEQYLMYEKLGGWDGFAWKQMQELLPEEWLDLL